MRRTIPRVLAIGDAIVDIVTPPIPALSARDAQLEVPFHSVVPGGNATNFALATAALGLPTIFVGCVGSDTFADVIRRAFADASVDARLRIDPARPTGMTVAVTWGRGGRALVTALGANAGLRATDVTEEVLVSARHVHRAGFWWTPRLIGRETVTILRRARMHGATTSLDVSTDPHGWPSSRVLAIRRTLPHVSTFFGNEVEVRAVGGRPRTIDAARAICRSGADDVVVHRGARGAVWVDTLHSVSSPGFRVTEDNPTGCGDVFNAGFIAARLRGADVLDALAFANACGASHLANRTRPYPRSRDARALLAHRRR